MRAVPATRFNPKDETGGGYTSASRFHREGVERISRADHQVLTII